MTLVRPSSPAICCIGPGPTYVYYELSPSTSVGDGHQEEDDLKQKVEATTRNNVCEHARERPSTAEDGYNGLDYDF
ncbi:hypothetical protein Tco_0450428 [Tanacetum coccineum]